MIGGRFGGWFEAFLARKVGWSVKRVPRLASEGGVQGFALRKIRW